MTTLKAPDKEDEKIKEDFEKNFGKYLKKNCSGVGIFPQLLDKFSLSLSNTPLIPEIFSLEFSDTSCKKFKY